ncbi:MAG TPA: ATP-binding protein, partial [Armatimonadota bacterium]|nr:ATP-binding protein [Armatimonadota bacterium]
ADPIRLRQLLDNILTNAFKFTPQDGTITVEAMDEGEWVRIDVSDTGIGLNKEHMASMFRPFWQADSSPSRRYSGTGIGLTVAKELVMLHGGRISAQSPGLDEGTRFTVRLPKDGTVAADLSLSAGPMSST